MFSFSPYRRLGMAKKGRIAFAAAPVAPAIASGRLFINYQIIFHRQKSDPFFSLAFLSTELINGP